LIPEKRRKPKSAARVLLTVIARESEAVSRELSGCTPDLLQILML
jgi:hypothetical protein